MRWISKGDPPLYVSKEDIWYNQETKLEYIPNLETFVWMNEKGNIPFKKNTKVYGVNYEKNITS